MSTSMMHYIMHSTIQIYCAVPRPGRLSSVSENRLMPVHKPLSCHPSERLVATHPWFGEPGVKSSLVVVYGIGRLVCVLPWRPHWDLLDRSPQALLFFIISVSRRFVA